MNYPWFKPLFNQIKSMQQTNRLPHALLFEANNDSGIDEFILFLAQALMCEKNTLIPCNNCSQCKLYNSDQIHPDCFEISKENEVIKIDEIRQLNQNLRLTSFNSKAKIALIYQADRMNVASNNALLKLLEEPPEHTYFFLTVSQRERLLPTIQSRCEVFHCDISFENVKPWLIEKANENNINDYSDEKLLSIYKLSQNRPLLAKDILINQEALNLRKTLFNLMLNYQFEQIHLLDEKQIDWIIFWLYTIVVDIMKLKLDAEMMITNSDCLNEIKQMANQFSYDDILNRYQKLNEFKNAQKQGLHLNKMLWLENWF